MNKSILSHAAVVAIVAASASVSTFSFANPGAVKAPTQTQPPQAIKRAGPHIKINTGTCNPNSPDVNYDKCREEVKGK